MNSNENLFLDILPQKLATDQLFGVLKSIPDIRWTPEATKESLKESINRIFYDLYVPTSRDYHLYEKVMDVIRSGYIARGPRSFVPTLNKIETAGKGLRNLREFAPSLQREMPGFVLLGLSGVGKTSSINRVLTLFESFHVHPDLQRVQVPYVKINCTAKGSTKQLCLEFFYQVDRTIGSSYFLEYQRRSYAEDSLMVAMAIVSNIHAIGVIIIDEIQNLNVSLRSGQDKMLNFFKNLNAIVGVPIIYIGTPEATDVLQGNFQQARRSKGIGSLLWDRFEPTGDAWDMLLKTLWSLQVVPQPGDLTDEIRNAYYEETQGLLDVLITLHVCVQKWALDYNYSSINGSLINDAAHSELFLLRPFIRALRSKEEKIMQSFSDIDISRIARQNKLKIINASTNPDPPESKSAKLIALVPEYARTFSKDELNDHANKLCKEYQDTDVNKLLVKFKSLLQIIVTERTKKVVHRREEAESLNSPDEIYNHLVKSGSICKIEDIGVF